ncbi:MAG: translocation/assembly module TamB [Muribaculaceae bacterium]|nr:translocation/assembly module TamB [Muribaculaceae bacterium]
MTTLGKIWNIIRGISVTLLLTAIVLPGAVYMILSTPWAQDRLREMAERELSALLQTKVSIKKVELHPFNELSVYGLTADDDNGREALHVGQVSAAFELRHFLLEGKLVIDYALLDGASVRLYKPTNDGPLNIAGILERLRSKDPNKKSGNFDLRINTVIVRQGSLDYDIMDAAVKAAFDPRHISLRNLNLRAYIPRISNEQYTVELERLGFTERSGFTLKDLTVKADVRTSGITMGRMDIELPDSRLLLAPVKLEFNKFEELPQVIRNASINLNIEDGSQLYVPDISAFWSPLANWDSKLSIMLDASGGMKQVRLNQLKINSLSGPQISLSATGYTEGFSHPDSLTFEIDNFSLKARNGAIGDIMRNLASDGVKLPEERILNKLDDIEIKLHAAGTKAAANADVRVLTPAEAISLTGSYNTSDNFKSVNFTADASINDLNLNQLFNGSPVSKLTADIITEGRYASGVLSGKLSAQADELIFKGHRYHDLSVELTATPQRTVEALLSLRDRYGTVDLDAAAGYGKEKFLQAHAEISELDLNGLNLTDKYNGYSLSTTADIDLSGADIDGLTGSVTLTNSSFTDASGEGLHLKNLQAEKIIRHGRDLLSINSDIFDFEAEGTFRLSQLPADLREMACAVLPELLKHHDHKVSKSPFRGNDFAITATVNPNDEWAKFFKLGVKPIYPVSIDGRVSDELQHADIRIDAPYLQQGNKLIESTAVYATVDAASSRATAYLTTQMPTKKGPMVLVCRLSAADNRVDTDIDWLIDRKIPLNGNISFSTLLARDRNDEPEVTVSFNPSAINFGEEVWSIEPSVIHYLDKKFHVSDFRLSTGAQSISLEGIAGPDEDDVLEVNLSSIDLIVIFETLEIDKALIGGLATGKLTASALLSGVPHINAPELRVKNISYNYCVLGDAVVKAQFDNEKNSFYLDADVINSTGELSHIYGDIYPATEELDINFDAANVKVGFMKPFMEAFASDVDGYASGHARLFGSFKYIDLEGDIYARDLKLKVDFTNTYYGCTDSIHIRPGVIDIKNVTVHDVYGNTAKLNGVVRHKFFKEPEFDFKITDARNLLCYNVDSKMSPDWYGTVFCNGGASVTGWPGVVNIDVNMTTTAGSTFTFVLSDRLDAYEYSFITFRDRIPKEEKQNEYDDTPELVKELIISNGMSNTDAPSAYNMDIQVDITPDAKMIIVMDPVGGDEIKATGSGNLRLTYGSVNEDLRIYGTYELNEGSYNFTLQDIIIKDFTIKPGSSITFRGDPYSASLDLNAVYSVNANLSDLDESFLHDKDLNRTNVPVNALLMVKGDMRQPDISFDLEFPTLTSDTYRKVRSIISTDDMMNRQIIYLLALNRFYTPDYMSSTTKGNEMFSVASSTLTSQLSSMLGKLSDNWSIAPNLRSDRGDFSDVEVDVALSSRLLNNRLLLNGNLGYRDKSLNTNQFIGDFDIEYLLNPKGTWRLKAYNRYNDQNYYLRSAATTQGVGIMFKRDFDSLFSFLHRKKKDKKEQESNTDKDNSKSPAANSEKETPSTSEADSTAVINTLTDSVSEPQKRVVDLKEKE